MRRHDFRRATVTGAMLLWMASTVWAQSDKPAQKSLATVDVNNVKKTSRAVPMALAWLARQQRAEGNWEFPAADGRPLAGWQSTTGATGLVLLPFLAAGQTHQKSGPYEKTVAAGLQFLARHADEHTHKAPSGVPVTDLCGEGGDWTWHAVATQALCEAYAMTRDKKLGRHAQLALDFIAARQAPTGGWAPLKPEAPAKEGCWWIAEEAHAARGGRLFQTAVVALSMQVYYRYLPLYATAPRAWRTQAEQRRSARIGLPPLPEEAWQPSRLIPHTSRLVVGETESLRGTDLQSVQESLPLRAMQLDVAVDGFRARVRMDLYFFDERKHGSPREGTFQLRLPGTASPSSFAFGATEYRDDAGLIELRDAGGGPAVQAPRAALEQLNRAASDPEQLARFHDSWWTQPRPARMVPREPARAAYARTMRRGIDPALVEWAGEGVFHCRVYPLQPEQLHHIVLGYDADLARNGDELELPVDLPHDKIPVVVDIHAPAQSADRLTVDPPGTRSIADGRVRRHFVAPRRGPIRVRLREPGPVVLAGADAQTGSYFAARFRPELPVDTASRGSDRGVFLADTSPSDNSSPFHLRLKLLRALLESNRGQIAQFAVLWFNVELRWWEQAFVANTPENVERLMKSANGLTLEGAADLGQALAEASSPVWRDRRRPSPPADLFLLSDGAVSWGEQDWPALLRIAQAAAPGRLWAYSGRRGGPGPLLSRLAGSLGGSALSVVSEAEITPAATAHRTVPWRLLDVEVRGAVDVLLSGRPAYLFPGQEVLLVGRGAVGPAGTEAVLKLARGDTALTLRTKLAGVVRSELAARTYGEVAVGQLEEPGAGTDSLAGRYARHFGITGRTCSLVMLERDDDYHQFAIDPDEDALRVKKQTAAVSMTAMRLVQGQKDPKAQFLAWIGRAEGDDRGEDAWRHVPTAARRAIDRMPPEAFAVRVPPLRGDPAGKGSAIQSLSSRVSARPDDPDVLLEGALSAMEWGFFGQAFGLLRRAAELAPGDPRTDHLLAHCLEEMGYADLAMVHHELAYDRRFGEGGDDLPAAGIALGYLQFLRKQAHRLSPEVIPLARLRLASIAAECDLRMADLAVSLRWDTDATDVDLRVVEPGGEECCYDHRRTAIGGRFGWDLRGGLGPETYVLHQAARGRYTIRACYVGRGDGTATDLRPTRVHATLYQYWGTDRERVTHHTVTLSRAGQSVDLGTVVMGQ